MYSANYTYYDLWDHRTSALRDLQWLPIQHCITYKLCVLMHLVHTDNSPSYLSDLVTTMQLSLPESVSDLPGLTDMNHWQLGWSLANAVFPIFFPIFSYLFFLKAVIVVHLYAGPKAWNSLPHAIQEITDSKIFKHKLKTFLFEHAFSTLW